jgi:hypothetical protein
LSGQGVGRRLGSLIKSGLGDFKIFDGVSGVKPEEALPVRESKV